jgi:hypothetical protein
MIATWPTSGRPRRERRSAIPRRPTSIAATAAIALALACCGVFAAGASADVAAQSDKRCGHGESVSGYTVEQYQSALNDMPAEMVEYTDCPEVIEQAELAAAGHRGGTGGGQGANTGTSPGVGGTAVEPTPAQQHILEATRHEHPAPIQLGDSSGGTVQPGVVHPDLASATSDLPTPVLAVIALVLAGLLLLAGKEIKERLSREEQS